jgi:GTP-dependent phosphoenolpyruvate carboxykinase
MYVVPYLLGPAGSSLCRFGVEITDSPHVVWNMGQTALVGHPALAELGSGESFVRGVHSLGDLSPDRRFVVHHPESHEIWSINAGYGDDALLSRKSHALRLASVQARREGWLAEHMMLLGVTNPQGQTRYVAAALARASGRRNLAMSTPALPGWKIEALSHDLCWMHPGEDGRLWAFNPEQSRPPVAHDVSQQASAPPVGVPISAILFGGRRARLAPLVYEARSWQHGVYIGATMASETIVPGEGCVPRPDPMAMRPFCGYNMGDYFAHWLAVGERLRHPPRVFHVNWFRTGHDGRLLWPGFGDNIRVFRWIFERIEGTAPRREATIGWLPQDSSLDLSGMDLTGGKLRELLAVENGAWLQEAGRSLEFLGRFAGRLPGPLLTEHGLLVQRIHHSLH